MIGYLEGKVIFAEKGKVILFCNGIGFIVSTPHNLNFTKSQEVQLFIHTHIREDDLALYGFQTAEDLKLFDTLISVSGVGPKIALTMLSVSSEETIKNAIISSDLAFFSSVPGVGKKTAQKIILDLRSKITKTDLDISKLEEDSDFTNSLVSLGFRKSEVASIYSKIDPSLPLDQKVKTALKLLKQ